MTQMINMKPEKASGPDGLCPGVIKYLPAQWIFTVTTLFNRIFSSAAYPSSWRLARMCHIHKKGNKRLPYNYRGINVINCLAKLFDLILSSRLSSWFVPFREQAGSQKGQGCIEHIVIVRLVMDLAKKKKYKLFVTFVDITMAYDRVPRCVLFRFLKRIGCRTLMLARLLSMYAVTHSVVGTAVVGFAIGVRQGSPTSCILSIIIVNNLIALVKNDCDLHGFLLWLHMLELMNDTVLLSTTRQGMERKLRLLHEYCKDYKMHVNNRKTKFFALNCSLEEKTSFVVGDMVVEWCEKYVYLGSVFTCDGSVSAAIAEHAQGKSAHVLKFV